VRNRGFTIHRKNFWPTLVRRKASSHKATDGHNQVDSRLDKGHIDPIAEMGDKGVALVTQGGAEPMLHSGHVDLWATSEQHVAENMVASSLSACSYSAAAEEGIPAYSELSGEDLDASVYSTCNSSEVTFSPLGLTGAHHYDNTFVSFLCDPMSSDSTFRCLSSIISFSPISPIVCVFSGYHVWMQKRSLQISLGLTIRDRCR